MNATLHSLARLGLIAAATSTVLFGTTACSLASVPADSVEQQIVSKLGAQGVSLDNGKADCATDLDATVGFGGDVFCPFLLQQEVGVACRIR